MAQPFGADYSRYYANGIGRDNARGPGFPGLKKRNHHLGNRSWILIDTKGNSEVMELDKPTVMRRCLLPSRDLRLLDPLFIHPSSILGRDKAIVVSLEQIRCIITADEVILKNSVEDSVLQYKYELCKRLEVSRDNYDDLPFEFRALEVALEHTCMSLDAQVCDEIEHLMNDDGDMAEMFLTEKKERRDILTDSDVCNQINDANFGSKYAPVSAVGSSSGVHRLQRAFSTMSSTKHGSFSSSSSSGENTDQLEMLLEAYFVGIDNTLNKLLSLKEYIDDTEDLINIKLGNVQNQLIKFELLLRAATFVTAMFAAVAAVFGMNFEDTVFDEASTFNWVLVISGICCGVLYGLFLAYFRNKKVIP
ncbi:magnesium transporter MRS2-5-like isoform X2 [Salvia hispanica]|uniref:magnesium transporter MRS2-5-like isoform X2 n=1 Tax=Salvia hispanica TaxID=49212 RepID=UPI002009228D|nr:magnesium transporter MRS2-5-like isoform X2 [Salvia hispanica]